MDYSIKATLANDGYLHLAVINRGVGITVHFKSTSVDREVKVGKGGLGIAPVSPYNTKEGDEISYTVKAGRQTQSGTVTVQASTSKK